MVVQPFGGLNSIALPPSADFFSIQPIDTTSGGGGTATAARTAGNNKDFSRIFDLALADLMDDEDLGPIANQS